MINVHAKHQDVTQAGIQTLADIEAIEATPLAQQNLAQSTYHIIQQAAADYGDKIALRFLLYGNSREVSHNTSYRNLFEKITQAANTFHTLGIGRKDVVSLLLPNLPQTHFALWGAEAAGIANPINPLLEVDQIAEIMNAAGTRLLVTLAPFPESDIGEKLDAICKKVPGLKAILTVDISQYLPAWKRWLLRVSRRGAASALPIHDFDRLLSQQPADRLKSGRKINPQDIASYFHTGGTTGTPKLAQHSHFNEVCNTWMMTRCIGNEKEHNGLCGLPLFHVNAVIVTGLFVFSVGGQVLLASPSGFRNKNVINNFWRLVQRYRISFFSGVPTIYSSLLEIPVADSDISSLRFGLCGAAPMPVELIKQFEKRTGLQILEGYGMTEGTCVSAVNPVAGERRPGSIGLRLPYHQIKVVKLDDDGHYLRDCQLNELGSIVIKGASVFSGYKQAERNKNIWVQDGWFNTGDLGRQDEDGYLWLAGRSKDLIIRGGHNIDPQLIEEILHRHPAVAVAAAVGRPDARLGELPIAYVSVRSGHSTSEQELLDFAASHISERAAVPKNIYIIENMPVTAVGKIFKPSLRFDAIKRVFEENLASLQTNGIHFRVTVEAHALHGQMANVWLPKDRYSEDLAQQIRACLSGFPIHTQVKSMPPLY